MIVFFSLLKIRGIYKLTKNGGLVIPEILRSRAAAGVSLGIIGIILTIGAIFNPWYTVQGNIGNQQMQTNSLVDLIVIDSFNGLQVFNIQEGHGLSPFFNFAFPITILLLVGVIFSFMDIIGARSSKSLGSKFVKSGILNLIPVLLIIGVIILLVAVLNSIPSLWGFPIGPEVKEVAQQISSAPIEGECYTNIQSYGSIGLRWGLGLGSYLFIGAAIVKFIAGAIAHSVRIPK
jgi:hypothetical protein